MTLKQILLAVHIFGGFLSLFSGILPLLLKKGSRLHILSGKVFAYSLLLSSVFSLPISWGSSNYFLFIIGLFTIYLVVSGLRAFKIPANSIDRIMPVVMIGIGIVFLTLSAIWLMNGKMIAIAFMMISGFSIFVPLRDLRSFGRTMDYPAKMAKHLGNMTGAYIASVTAFLVVNFQSGLMGWMLPSLVGTAVIIYWIRKVNPKTQTS